MQPNKLQNIFLAFYDFIIDGSIEEGKNFFLHPFSDGIFSAEESAGAPNTLPK